MTSSALAYHSCEINFVKYINGEMPADLAKNPAINLWNESFDSSLVFAKIKSLPKDEQQKYLLELSKLVHKDQTFNDNIVSLINKYQREGIIDKQFIDRHFLKKEFEFANFYYSSAKNEVTTFLDIDPEKMDYIKKIVTQFELSAKTQTEYEATLLRSNLTHDDLQFAIKKGMKLREDPRDLEQFKRYLDFLDNTKPHKIKKALKNIEDIYVYSYKASILPYNPLQKPHVQFLEQNARLEKFTGKRVKEIERGLKLQQKSGVVEEIDEIVQKEANGFFVDIREKLRLKKRVADEPLPASLKKRAAVQAKHETSIYRKLLNGCNSGNSQRLDSAKKKFSRFKFGLTLGIGPALYIFNNTDKMDTDPYFWEKLGHEVVMGILFTYVGNKLFTNTSTTFWRKYVEGYVKFGALSYVEAWSYEELFGGKSLIRHFQKLYKGKVPESEIEEAFNKLKNSKDFEKQINELFAYLDDMGKKNNTKNFLDKHFNLSTHSSLDDSFRITQEDLETEEAREMVMELVAERLYLQSMGDWPLFQTGGKDTDRFAFYRARNILWDMEGLIMNLAIFELMCREPLGKVGSWGAIIAMVMAEKYFLGDITYQYRRDAINQ